MAKNCINCNNPLPDEAVFCTVCGTRQPENRAACPQCGAPLAPGAAFCTVCGTALNTAPAQPAPVQNTPSQQAQPVYPQAPPPVQASAPAPQPVQQTPPQQNTYAPAAQAPQPQAQPVYPQAAQPQNTYAPQQQTSAPPAPAPTAVQAPADKPKKSKKKWIITGIGAGALVLAVVLFLVFILPLFGKSAEDDIVFKAKGKEYYASPYLFRLNGEKEPELVTVSGSEERIRLNPELTAINGNDVYCLNSFAYGADDEDWFVKYTFSSDTVVTKSRWVDNNAVKNCVFSSSDSEAAARWVTAICGMTYSNGWIYFRLDPDMEYRFEQGDIMGKVGRISADGKKIEQVGDINACDMIVDGDWVYYTDCGYIPSADGRLLEIKDFSSAGIYKVKTNGKDKKLIHAFTIPDRESISYNNGLIHFTGEMKIIDGKLWFLDYSPEGHGRLCRMDKNGKGLEYLSSSVVSHYAVDGKSAYLYGGDSSFSGGYYAYNTPSNPTLYKLDIKTKAETKMPFVKGNISGMTCYKGYLYFTGYGFAINDKTGLRLNLKTGTAQWLKTSQESSWVTDPQTGKKSNQLGEMKIYWEDAKLQ